MNKLKRLFIGLLVTSLLTASIAPLALAKFAVEEDRYTLAAEEVIDDDLFVAGEEVTIYGTVNGDLFVGAGRVVVDGVIHGDIYAGAGEITISGVVDDDVIVGTGVLNLDNAQIGGSVLVAAGNVKFDSDSTIGGAVIYSAGVVEMGARVTRGVIGAGGLLDISGFIGKDTVAFGEEIRLQSTAQLDGSLAYASEKEPDLAEGAIVSGEITQLSDGAFWKVDKDAADSFWSFTGAITVYVFFIGYLLLGLLILHFFPKQTKEVSKQIFDRPFMSLFLGTLILLVTPIVALFIGLTVFGLPLAFVMTLLYILNLCITKVFIGIFLGDSIANIFKWKKVSPYWLFVLGLVTFYLLRFIAFNIHPGVAAFVVIFSYLFTFGGMALMYNGLLAKFKKGKV